MTKAELIRALEGVPDEAKVYIECVPEGSPEIGVGDLHGIDRAAFHPVDGPGTSPFAVLVPDIQYT